MIMGMLLCASPALASNLVGFAGNLCPSTNNCPPATPVPTATSTPNFVPGQPVDGNATPQAKNLLGLLVSLEGKSSGHALLGSAAVVRSCDSLGCAEDNTLLKNISAGKQAGIYHVDMCNEDWGAVGQPMCVFGTGGDAYQQAVAAHAAGSVIMMSMDPPNPITGYTNPPTAGANTASQPCASYGARAGQSGDCTGVAVNFGSLITQNGNSYNTNFNSLLNNWVSTFKSFQSQNIPIIFRPYQEEDLGWAWWNYGALNGSQQAQLFQYTETYFESQGVHNLLYAYTVYSSVPQWPGNNYVDIAAYDNYGSVGSAGAYSTMAAYGKPVMIPEFNCSSAGGACIGYSNYDSSVQFSGGAPLLVGMTYWDGIGPYCSTNNGCNSQAYPGTANTTWGTAATDPLALMAGSFANP